MNALKLTQKTYTEMYFPACFLDIKSFFYYNKHIKTNRFLFRKLVIDVKSKPLGLESRVADSILRFTIKHYDEYKNEAELYNAWLHEAIINEGIVLTGQSIFDYALSQAEACLKTSLEHLRICMEIEDCVTK